MISIQKDRVEHASTQIDAAFNTFQQAYPSFEQTRSFDNLRRREYASLDALGHIYLDYTGGGLYAGRQIQEHQEMLHRSVLGNPHSVNPTSNAATRLIEQVRRQVLAFFHASEDEYEVIFTANASGALRLVGEAYPFSPDVPYLLLSDNHNSVNGIREFARSRGAPYQYVPLTFPELRGDETHLLRSLDCHHSGGLFAYPAQSNFSGVQHPLEWIALAQARGWDVLLDAAAYVPTNVLDLSQWHPDFVTLSFYKIFGYPTGIGCLLARKEKLAKLKRPWFAGGTVWSASVQGDWHVLSEGGERYEDGTLNYLMLPAVEIGLNYIQSIGVEAIHQRVICFTDWLLATLVSLKHQTGVPLIHIHGPVTSARRGATIAFNLLDPSGRLIDERVLDQRAAAYNISLRTGCFCNPGVGETIYDLSKWALLQRGADLSSTSYDELMRTVGLPTFGAHRVSLGIATNFADLYHFLYVLQSFLDTFPETSDLPERRTC